jgi:arylsulfotransferase ASST
MRSGRLWQGDGRLWRGGSGAATGGSGGETAGSGGATGGFAGATGGFGGATDGSGVGGVSSGAGGTRGMGTPEVCSFAIDAALSTAIPTVGIVNWSTDLAGLSEARIEFTLDHPAADEINRGSGGKIDVAAPIQRALMLGLKADRTYTYRIVASGGGKLCNSADETLRTGAATNAPTVTRTGNDPAAQAGGFIVTCEYINGGSSQPRPKMAYIIDADGDVVWWSPQPSASCSRALIDWEGANMWMVEATGGAANIVVHRIGMDGTGEQNVPELARAHHDIAALPGGIVAALVWIDPNGAMYKSVLIERSPGGTVKTVVRLDNTIFKPRDNGVFHANSILYHLEDDTYTLDLTGSSR